MSATASLLPSAPASTVRSSLADVIRGSFSRWTLGVPYPLLFVAGAAVGVLFASLIVLFTHSTRASTANSFGQTPVVAVPPAPAATWQPNVITIHPAAPDPMFDTPMTIEPASLAAAPVATPRQPATAKKAVTRSNVRRHPAGKHVASGDLLTAAL